MIPLINSKVLLSVRTTNPLTSYQEYWAYHIRNYTITKKKLLTIVERLKQFRGILFCYEINLFSNHKNLAYVTTLSKSQRVMRRRLIIKEFGPNIKQIARTNKIVSDTLSILPSNSIKKYETCTRNAQCPANKSFAIGTVENKKNVYQ